MRDGLRLLAFAGNLLCFAVCTKCSETYTHCFANVEDNVRNAPKQPRKTVMVSIGAVSVNVDASVHSNQSVLMCQCVAAFNSLMALG